MVRRTSLAPATSENGWVEGSSRPRPQTPERVRERARGADRTRARTAHTRPSRAPLPMRPAIAISHWQTDALNLGAAPAHGASNAGAARARAIRARSLRTARRPPPPDRQAGPKPASHGECLRGSRAVLRVLRVPRAVAPFPHPSRAARSFGRGGAIPKLARAAT